MISWSYLDKRDATIKALKDYDIMKFIIEDTSDEIRQIKQKAESIGAPKYSEHIRSGNAHSGEDRIVNAIEEIDTLRERYRQAQEYMAWFEPAWKQLSEDEQYILESVYLDEVPINGTGEKQPTGLLHDTNGAQLGVTTAAETAVTFDEIFQLYYALKAPYRRKAAFLCNEALVLQLMTIKDKNDNYIWKPSLDIAKPDTILGRPIYTSTYMPAPAKGEKALCFGDYSFYWVADRSNRTFRRLNELYATTDQVGFLTTQRVDGKLILPETVKYLKMKGTKAASTGGGTTGA